VAVERAANLPVIQVAWRCGRIGCRRIDYTVRLEQAEANGGGAGGSGANGVSPAGFTFGFPVAGKYRFGKPAIKRVMERWVANGRG